MPDYLQHGRRHGAGGSDPIPGLGNATLAWAYISASAATTCAGGNITTSLTAAAGHFFTNDSSIFSAGTNGIKILAVGHYFVICTAGPTAPVTAGSLYEVVNTGGGAANFFGGKPVARIPTGMITDEGLVSVENVMTITSADIPTAPIVTQIINSSSGSVSIKNFGTWIYQLDTDQTVVT